MPLLRNPKLNILDLNDYAFEAILSHLSFDDIAKIRLVSRRFNNTCQVLLNKGFATVEQSCQQYQKEVEAKLPRRESERNVHPLYNHTLVLTGVNSCILTLACAYKFKFYSRIIYPFIPGKVLDECYRLLRVVMSQKQPLLNVDDVLRELRGMNTAASDHFTKRIIPANKGAQGLQMISTGISSSYSCLTVNEAPVFKTEDRLLIDRQRNEISNLKSKVLAQEKLLKEHEQKWTRLEQRLGFSVSETSASSADLSNPLVASPSEQGKRPLQDADGEGPRHSKRLQRK